MDGAVATVTIGVFDARQGIVHARWRQCFFGRRDWIANLTGLFALFKLNGPGVVETHAPA